jgi:hypothetical protein
MTMATQNDNEFMSRFVVLDSKGAMDEKRTSAAFILAAKEWQKFADDLKPLILAELAEYKRLGETTLVPYVCHRAHVAPTSENVERVEAAIKELETQGKIVRQVSESGSIKGRNSGYTLPGQQTAHANGAAATA